MKRTYIAPLLIAIDFAPEGHLLQNSIMETKIDNNNEVGADESLSNKKNQFSPNYWE